MYVSPKEDAQEKDGDQTGEAAAAMMPLRNGPALNAINAINLFDERTELDRLKLMLN